MVIFRYVPAEGYADDFNRQLLEEIQQDGRVYLSSTMVEGRFVISLAGLSFRTHLDTIDLLLEILKEKVAHLKGR